MLLASDARVHEPAIDLPAADHERMGAAELRSNASERLLETLMLFRSSEVEPGLVAERANGRR